MKIPLFWAKGAFKDDEGRSFFSWRWSEISVEDALKKAVEAAKSIAGRLSEGETPEHRYYGERPLREEVLKELKDGSGQTYAAITRNCYGCEVLNTAAVMFVDVDLKPISAFQMISYGIKRLFSSRTPHPMAERESEALAKLKAMTDSDKECGARVYRTYAGFRYMMTHALIEPKAEFTVKVMEFLGTDKLYMRLCAVQESFRARLTPKPWRCGVKGIAVKFPRETKAEDEKFRDWQRSYENAHLKYSTCRFMMQLGNSEVHPEIQPILKLHDDAVKATTGLLLA